MTKILLAEDNPDNAETIIDYLEAHQLEVFWAQNGRVALNMIATEKPGLVLMDIHMPEMNGIEAMQILRAQEETADLPIIAITALVMPGDKERILAAGANEYVSKPVKLRYLLQRCSDYLNFEPHAPQKIAISPSPAGAAPVPGRRADAPLILIADDDKATVGAYEDLLEAKGYRAVSAATGEKALALAQVEKPDLILMDINLPDVNGLEITRRIRQNPALMETPIIVLTGLTGNRDRRLSLEAGATMHLSKPIGLWDLLENISAALKD